MKKILITLLLGCCILAGAGTVEARAYKNKRVIRPSVRVITEKKQTPVVTAKEQAQIARLEADLQRESEGIQCLDAVHGKAYLKNGICYYVYNLSRGEELAILNNLIK